jgi:tRNA(Ile)-lysidine synthase
MNIHETLRATIRRHNLLPKGSKIVIGVSGGADSLALLHLLHQLAPKFNLALHAATFDHQLRGEDSRADVEYVRETAEKWGIPVTVGAGDVRELAAREKLSIEVAARRARYDFLAEVAQTVVAERIAVAHHQDDQAETVLMRLVRGTGLRGLGGMSYQAPLPYHPKLILIRPLLDVTRAEIEAYCAAHHLSPRQDATNQDTSILRNFIRRETLPGLHQFNPHIQNTLAQFAEIAALENSYMQEQLESAMRQAGIQMSAGRVTINRQAFHTLHPALQRRFIAWAYEQLADSDTMVGYTHILTAAQVGTTGALGAVAELPGNLRLRVDYTLLAVERADEPLPVPDIPLLPEGAELDVPIPGIIKLEGWQLKTSPGAEVFDHQLNIPANMKLTLRTPRAGDRFRPVGMNGHTQKLNRWMINHKVPNDIRGRIPLLCADGEIAAVLYGKDYSIGEPFAVHEGSQRVIYFELSSDR